MENELRLKKPAEVASQLAISIRALWRLVAGGDFPRPIKIGGSTRFLASEIEDWVRSQATYSSEAKR